MDKVVVNALIISNVFALLWKIIKLENNCHHQIYLMNSPNMRIYCHEFTYEYSFIYWTSGTDIEYTLESCSMFGFEYDGNMEQNPCATLRGRLQ